MALRQVKFMFILKPRKSEYTEAKAYHPISLTFLVKMEKLVDRHMRDSVLKEHPLHQNQHAYQIGRSTENELSPCGITQKVLLNARKSA